MVAKATAGRVLAARERVQNAQAIATAAFEAGLQFYIACALTDRESGGQNIYGHDVGGVNTVKGILPVTAENFFPFLVKVMNGATSNGVGPLQITYAGTLKNSHRDGGHFRLMAESGLCPWVPEDNLLYGFRTFVNLLESHGGDIAAAGAEYNGGGSPNAKALKYGRDLKAEALEWHGYLNP